MSKEDDYRRHAADTLNLAQRATSSSDKTRLLHMADAWLDLADRAHKVARLEMREHAPPTRQDIRPAPPR